jgi:hypothetical protein
MPDVQEPVVWETERQGAPGKLTFTVLKDPRLNFQEGNHVAMNIDGKDVFYGFVFTKRRDKNGLIDVTAYDQLRYLKNKDLIQYENKTASDVIKKLAENFYLDLGDIEDTGYVIPERLEDNKTLFDVVKNALEETLQVRRQMYVLYDDFGKLMLKNIESMKLDLLINQETAENFDYSSSIDSNTYNRIRLAYDDEKKGRQFLQIPELTSTDLGTIRKWGVLQYFETLQNSQNVKAKAEGLLSFYNRKTRSLTVSKAFGDIRVRGGSSLPVTLDLGDVVAKQYMIVEKVKHTISSDTHFMDLTLIGGDFSA